MVSLARTIFKGEKKFIYEYCKFLYVTDIDFLSKLMPTFFGLIKWFLRKKNSDQVSKFTKLWQLITNIGTGIFVVD